MNNLKKLIVKEQKNNSKYRIELLKTVTNEQLKSGLNSIDWRLTDLLTKGQKNYINVASKKITLNEFKAMIKSRLKVYENKRINAEFNKLLFSENLQPIENITITVDWKRSKTWGMNPNAESFVYGLGTLKSGSVSGCGYDKLSTAVANVLNQIPQFLQLMYVVKNKNCKKSNRECLGYGSGYGILPAFEGGVGVSCYDRIFTNIGYKFETVSSGKTFDVFSISKISRKEQKEKLQRLYNYQN